MKGIIWILVVVVIAIVGYLAYTEGYFTGADEADNAGLNIDIGGSSPAN